MSHRNIPVVLGLAKNFPSSYKATEYLGTNKKMAKTSKRPKMGRPPLPPEKRKRPSMGFRPTAEMRRKLEEMAAASGLSLTQEVERRLEQSFRDEDALGGRECYALFRMMGAAADLIEARTGKSATSDWETSVAVTMAWTILIAEWRPPIPKNFKAKIVGPDEPLPPIPALPSPPTPNWADLKDLSTDFIDDLAKEDAEYVKALHQHYRIFKKWQPRWEEKARKHKDFVDHLEGLLNIGRETALGLFPEKRKKQG